MKTTNVISFRRLVRDAYSFEQAIENLLGHGIKTRGRAIMLAREHNPEGYNAWMAKRHRAAAQGGSGGGSSIMQHFRVVGG